MEPIIQSFICTNNLKGPSVYSFFIPENHIGKDVKVNEICNLEVDKWNKHMSDCVLFNNREVKLYHLLDRNDFEKVKVFSFR